VIVSKAMTDRRSIARASWGAVLVAMVALPAAAILVACTSGTTPDCPDGAMDGGGTACDPYVPYDGGDAAPESSLHGG
jgi:hypothetical protein